MVDIIIILQTGAENVIVADRLSFSFYLSVCRPDYSNSYERIVMTKFCIQPVRSQKSKEKNSLEPKNKHGN